MRALAGLMVFFFSAQAVADTFAYRFKVFPRGEKCESSDHWCYTFEEFKQLIEFDSELNTKREQFSLLGEQMSTYRELVKNLSYQVQLSLDIVTLLQKETARLSEKWVKTDKALQKCEYDSPIWPWLVLGVAGLVLVVGVVLIAVYAVDDQLSSSQKALRQPLLRFDFQLEVPR